MTVLHKLKCAGMSHKKLKYITIKYNKGRLANFVAKMMQYEPEELEFLDKSKAKRCAIA